MFEIRLFSLTVRGAGSCWKSDYFHLQCLGLDHVLNETNFLQLVRLDHAGNQTMISNSPWVFIMLEISLFYLTVSEAGSCWKSDYYL